MKFGFYNIFKAKNLVKQPVPDSKLDKKGKITKWDEVGGNNDFPQKLLQTVYDSPVASAAMDVWTEFISSSGFKEEGLNKLKVNKEDTLLDLEQKVAQDLSLLDGMAVHVGYNSEGKPSEFNHMPFESTRLGLLDEKGITNKIYFNPYYGIPQSYNKKYDEWFYTYNPDPEFVQKQMQDHASDPKIKHPYPGQIFWFSIEKPLARVYPQPFYNSSVNWMRVDAKIQEFHERNIDNNFLLSILINVYGNPDEPAGRQEDPEGDSTGSRDQPETNEEVLNEQLKAIGSGAKNGGGAFVNWFSKEEEKMTFEQFPTNANDELFDKLQTMVDDKISTGTKVPRVLNSLATGGKLGDTQEILNAIKVMQGRAKKKQILLSEKFKKILQGFETITEQTDFSIPPHIPFDILPDFVFDKLTPQEQRKWIDENFALDLDLDADLPAQAPTFERVMENIFSKNGSNHVHTID